MTHQFHHRPDVAATLRRCIAAVVGSVLIIVLFLQPPGHVLASSWSPTKLVNTEAFEVIDDSDTSANVVLRFGDTVNKEIRWDRVNSQFQVTGPIEVLGAMSGVSLTIGSLKSCDTIDTNLNGVFTCGTDATGAGGGGNWSGTGALATFFDRAYVNTSGDSMTGTLIIKNNGWLNASGSLLTNTGAKINSDRGATDAVLSFGNATSDQALTFIHSRQLFNFSTSINVIGTASGRIIHAQDQLRSSGSLAVEGDSTLDNTFYLNSSLNRVGIGGDFKNPETTLEVGGTLSGASLVVSNLKSCDTIDTSANGVFTCGTDAGGGAGISQSDGDARYLQKQGSKKSSVMSGALVVYVGTTSPVPAADTGVTLEVLGTMSGRMIHAQNRLASSGSFVAGGITVLKPSATQAISAAGNTILANASAIVLDPNANYTMTSAPTIADGLLGQMLTLTAANSETNKVILQDQDILASSNIQLGSGSNLREVTGKKTLSLIFDGTDWVETAYTDDSVNIQIFTATGANTWTKPSGAKAVYVVCVGGGGGGGGANGTAAGAARNPGGGGGGGGRAEKWFVASDLGATETATVGQGGNGGPGGVAAAGTAGTAGVNSTFGTYLTCYGGGFGKGAVTATASAGGGGGGTAGVGANGAAVTNLGGLPASVAGANGIAGQGGGGNIAAAAGNAEYGGGGGNGAAATPAASGAGGSSIYGAGGGGGGGGVVVANTVVAAGAGGNVGAYANGGGGAAGTSSATCTNGTNGTAGTSTKMGQGGGGGGSDTDTVGCIGGTGGALGGGGGGGGGGTNTGGRGGKGGRGEIRVYTFF